MKKYSFLDELHVHFNFLIISDTLNDVIIFIGAIENKSSSL